VNCFLSKLKDSINKFEKMLNEFPDSIKYTKEFYYFFRQLPLQNIKYIPYVELGTILKYEKPVIFTDLKKYAIHNKILEIVTSVQIDLNNAIDKIAEIKKDSVE